MHFPNFFVVGAAKAGTTFLGDCLCSHPEIYVSPIKEPHFFSTDIRVADFRQDYKSRVSFDLAEYFEQHPLPKRHMSYIDDLPSYLALFREVSSERAVGELSAGYLYSKCAADNIYAFNPNAKIAMILRQPVERAYSHYQMDIRDFWTHDSGFLDALERDFALTEKGWGRSALYVELGLYAQQVQRYLDRFPENQIKIFLYEDLKDRPIEFLKELYDFLAVDAPEATSAGIVEHKNVAMQPRFKMRKIHLSAFMFVRRMIGAYLPASLKQRLRKVLFSNKDVRALGENEFNTAMKYFSDDILKLSVLIKRELGSWHKFRR